MRRFQHDGICTCCGKVGPTMADVERDDIGGFQTAEFPELPPLCDSCDYAQRRWDCWHGSGYLGYPYLDQPPKSPPIRRPS